MIFRFAMPRIRTLYRITSQRIKQTKISEHKKQTVLCEFDTCPPVSLTQEKDLGWSDRMESETETKDHGELSLYVAPWGGGVAQVPIDCYTPCALSCPK